MQLPVPSRLEIPASARRLTAAASICETLRDAIVALRLAPGSPIQEKELTTLFGVSRTPVREALIRLAEEGLVDIRPQSGTFVSRIPLAALPEAVIVRQALEATTVERAAAAITDEGRKLLDANLARQESFAGLDDTEAFHHADEALHELIAVLSGHPGIWRVVRSAKIQLDRYRRLTLPVPGRMKHLIAEHRAVCEAVKAGDPERARQAMRKHLDAVLPPVTQAAATHAEFFV